MSFLLTDLRLAFRSFARQPAATAVVVLTLALAVAANAAVFTLLDGIFFRPFPFPRSGQLVYLNERAPKWNLQVVGISYPHFATWQRTASAFESMYGSSSFEATKILKSTDPAKLQPENGAVYPNGPLSQSLRR